jgi:uncharacterized protein (TIGR02231 family)
MAHRFCILLVLLANITILSRPVYCAETDVTSRVERVTIYQESAEITRRASVSIPEGSNTVIFTGVPSGLNSDSLRVGGKGSAKISISGVEFKNRYLKGELSPQAEELDKKIKNVERELQLLVTNRTRLETQKQLIGNVSLDSRLPAEQEKTLRPRTPQEMGQVLSFINDASAKLDGELHGLAIKIEDATQALNYLKKERALLQTSGKQESVISVKLDAEAAGNIELELTYQVSGASWRPTYNLHVNDAKDGSKFQLETYALVKQSTGEDWSDIELSVSTASAHVGLTRPIPSPKVIDIFNPAPLEQEDNVAAGSVRSLPAMKARSETLLSRSRVAAEVAPAPLMEEITEDTANLDSLGLYVYKVPRKTSIPSSNSQEKIKLGAAAMTGNLLNVAVPALQQYVYREALVKNTTGAPLLPGAINVFANGSFIGKQSIEFTQSEREVRLSVGLSDTLLVTRKEVKRFEEDSGVVRSFRKISVGYDFKIENLLNAPQEIVVLEPSVVSQNEKIKVQIDKVSPAALDLKDPKRIQKDAGILEWRLTSDPKSSSTIHYEAQIEFETGLNVVGLEGIQ